MSNFLISFLLIFYQINCINKYKAIYESLDDKLNQEIEIGVSYTYSIEYKKETNFTFNVEDNDIYQINIHSINCNFKLDFNGDIMNQINLNSYSLKMNETNKNITIKPLINKRDGIEKENYDQKKCYLSINSLNLNNPEVKIENEDNSIFFFKNYDRLNISYAIEEFPDDGFAAIFFRFDENSDFSVEITYNNITEHINLISKNIYNSTYVFLNSDILKNNNIDNQNINLNIIINKNGNKTINMFFKIIEKEMITMLEKNALNYGFMTTKLKYQYFYLEVFNEEEGELMLHNKQFYAELYTKIVTKDEINYTDIYNSSIYPKKKVNDIDSTFINYNPHYLKLIYTYKDTINCSNGCYILITYNQKQTIPDFPNIGYEFTLLSRSWNFSDYNPQIIDIPFNEYLLGFFEINSINTYHYYSIVIPEEAERIIIQLEGNYIDCFYGEGRKKINSKSIRKNAKNLNIMNNQNVITLKIEDLNFKDKRITFALRSKDYFDNIFSFYYFRLLYVPKDQIIFFPLDSQLGNLCLPEKNIETNYFYCHLIFSNKYNELDTEFSLSTFNQNEYSKIYIKKIFKNGEVQDDFNEMFYIYDKNDITDIDYFIFTFEFQNSEIKNILSYLFEKISNYYLQIYSSQLFYHTGFIYKSYLFSIKSNYTLINNFISGGISSGLIDFDFLNLFFPVYRNQKGTLFIIDIDSKRDGLDFISDVNWLYILKLEYNMRNKGIIEIKSGETKDQVMESGYFPLYYYMKIKNKNYINVNVNIRLNYWGDFFMKNDLIIKGYIVDEDTIIRKSNGEYIPLDNPIYGIYSDKTRSGLLEVIQDKKYDKDNYLLIEIKNKETSYINSHLFLELITKEYNEDFYFMPANQYIIDTFKDINDTIRDNNNYHICTNIKGNMVPYLAIGPEYNDLEIIFINITNNNTFKCSDFNCTIEDASGLKKYNLKNYSDDNIYFKVINPKKRKANYMIIFYYNQDDADIFYYLNDTIYKEYIEMNKDNITLSVTFEPLELFQHHEKYILTQNIDFYFYISGFLYKKKENSEELLNTTSLLYEKTPLYENQTSSIINMTYAENFTLVFKDIPRKDNFIYDLQIKIILNLDYSPLERELLTYVTEVDLTDIKIEEFVKEEEKTNIWIILGPILGFITLLVIFFIIKYIRLSKANINLKEDLKSIAYSSDIQKNVVNLAHKDRSLSETDSDYESTFY